MRLRGIFIVIVFLTCYCCSASAQNNIPDFTDSLAKKIQYYSAKKQQGVLFAHFDKTIYTNNENVWFTAYLLNADANKNDVLSAVLINDNDRSIVLKDKFVMAKGIAFGNIFLPDSLLTANYSFMLYTSSITNGQPQNVFTQPITVKNTNEISYKATLLLEDTSKIAPEAGRKVLLVTNAAGMKLVSGATVKYYLGDKQHPIIAGTVKTDAAGQYLFTIPAKDITLGNNVLQAQITYNKETQIVKLALPVQQNIPVVRFYPEGGNLADGIASIVGWEVKNNEGVPYALRGVLFKDGQPIDTLITNSYGIGKFALLPQRQSRYYVKLILADNPDSVYNLPKILINQPVITMANAVADDTLRFTIKSKLPATYYVLVHNYKQTFFSFPVQVAAGERKVKILLTGVPKGLAEITILDSLQRPYAERLFFSHYNLHNTVNVAIDTGEYKTRQKVNLKLNLSGPDGKPLTGIVSIACVEANRLEINKATDIARYVFLDHELGTLPIRPNYLGNSTEDKAFLEDILLIKGWRRYTWTELMQTTAADTIRQQDSLVFKGKIVRLDKPIIAPVTVITARDSTINTFVTQPNGSFALADTNLFVMQGKRIHLYVTGIPRQNYDFSIIDPYDKINSLLAAHYQLHGYDYLLLNEQRETPEDLKKLEHAIHLKEVKIKGTDDNQLTANACGDYYCIYRVLDCPNHRADPRNKIPVKGGAYYQYDATTNTQSLIIYPGCNPDEYDPTKGLDGIHYSREFYPVDYSVNSPTQPEYLSTIYWNSLYTISPGNKTSISFYTSDITGTFKIIVQGVTDKGVVYGEKAFVVSK